MIPQGWRGTGTRHGQEGVEAQLFTNNSSRYYDL